jgi:hypothetical protein
MVGRLTRHAGSESAAIGAVAQRASTERALAASGGRPVWQPVNAALVGHRSDDGAEAGVWDVGKASELPDYLGDPWHVIGCNEWLNRSTDVEDERLRFG